MPPRRLIALALAALSLAAAGCSEEEVEKADEGPAREDTVDSSFDAGQPFEFEPGAGMVIPGWDRGLAGMRVGGRRKLTIPPDLAYGANGSPPKIGPNETLAFVIDLLGRR